ncbi:hypothetical protein D3C72_2587180 [compost metagenome]
MPLEVAAHHDAEFGAVMVRIRGEPADTREVAGFGLERDERDVTVIIELAQADDHLV